MPLVLTVAESMEATVMPTAPTVVETMEKRQSCRLCRRCGMMENGTARLPGGFRMHGEMAGSGALRGCIHDEPLEGEMA